MKKSLFLLILAVFLPLCVWAEEQGYAVFDSATGTLTFKYGESGQVIPLCKCKRLIYVTTAGGYIGDNNFGYDYVKALCVHLFGIDNIVCVSAEGLDIIGNDIEAILKNAENAISTRIVSVERFNPKTDHYSN